MDAAYDRLPLNALRVFEAVATRLNFADAAEALHVTPAAVSQQVKSLEAMIRQIADENQFTIRQLYQHVASARGHFTVVGSASQIVDVLEDWFHNEGADGFNILPPWLPTGLTDFVDLVVPELQRRGLFRTGYEATTLRGNLGLPMRGRAPGR